MDREPAGGAPPRPDFEALAAAIWQEFNRSPEYDALNVILLRTHLVKVFYLGCEAGRETLAEALLGRRA